MARSYKAVYLSDGRKIKLSTGFETNNTTRKSFIMEAGDDFFCDLINPGDVQTFRGGARIEFYARESHNMTMKLYRKNGSFIGYFSISGRHFIGNADFNKMTDRHYRLAVIPFNNFGIDSNPSMATYMASFFTVKSTNPNIPYSYSDDINTVKNWYSSGYIVGGFQLVMECKNLSKLQPPTGIPFSYDNYIYAWAAVGTVDSWAESEDSGQSRFYKFLREIDIVDVYEGEDLGDESTTGGQDGTYTDSTDIIPIPDLPTITASSCGLVKMYELTVEQAINFADFIWSSPSEVFENLKKMLANPMDAIISLQLCHVNASASEATNIVIGGIDSGVTGLPLTSQYVQLDCGEVNINKFWGNCLDFSPYTKASIYLPMIGTQVINADDIMGKRVRVTYNIDILSGSVIAFISVNDSVLYSYQGNANAQIPLTGADNSSLTASTIGAVASGVAIFATGGASIPVTAGVGSAMAIMNSKQSVQRGGSISGNGAVLGGKYPFITLERAVQSLPNNFKHFKGYASNITMPIGSLNGYTEIEYIDISGIGALKEEIEMLNSILKDGFYC